MQVGEAVLLDGRYRLERVLGSGGTSEVWLARDVVANVPVAIKRVLPGAGGEARDALRREAQIGRRLHHVNIVQVLESGEARGLPYLVTEYVEGPSLRELLGWRGGLPEADVVDIGRAVASALAHAHRRGILHNDLKPENILLGPTGPKVADFGAASSLTQTVGPQRAQELMGTIAYLAPEVLQGEEPSIRSDLYALGLTLYEAAAGRLPFPGATPAAIAGQRLAQPPPPVRVLVPSASYELEATLARALQLNPSARFASAAELAAWLAAAPMVGHATVVIRRRTPGPPVAAVRTGGGSRRGRIVAGSGVVGLLFAGGALALGLWSGDKGVDDPGRDFVAQPAPTETTTQPPATATPTEVPPTPTPQRIDNGNRGHGDGNDGNSGRGHGNGNDGDGGNRGRGDGNSDREDGGPEGWSIPTPPSAEDALSYIFESLREAFEWGRD